MERIKWKEVVEKVKEVLILFQNEDVKPTLRGVFYRLVSDNVIPNTQSKYNKLSSILVKARKEGEIDFDAMEDRGRYSIFNFGDDCLDEEDLDDVGTTCDEKIEDINIDTIIDDYFCSVSPYKGYEDSGYWARQPIIVEMWTEKDAIASILNRWTSDLSINIRVNRGYDSWSFLYACTQQLKETLERHDKVVILYIGDLDPSGMDMDRHITEVINFFQLTDRVKFRRIALLPEQVERYNLPPKPGDAETLAKVARDPRTKKYKEKYITEVDAFLGLAPEAFKELIQEAILEYYDAAISAEVREEKIRIINEAENIVNTAKQMAKESLLSQIRGGL